MYKKFFVIFMLCIVMVFPVSAQQDKKQTLKSIEDYINALSTAKGRFRQLSSSGGYAGGDFYLSRPGKLRLDYDAPNNIQLIADGDDFIYYDKELGQVTYLSLDSSIAGVLVKDNFSFSNPEFKIDDVSFVDGTIRVAISSIQDALAGKIILIFKERPLQLVKWQVIDAQGIATTVLL